MLGFIKEDHIPIQVYCNSFIQKTSGSDCNFILNTGQSYSNVMAVELNQFKMINVLTSCDKGAYKDFSDFSFNYLSSSISVTATEFYSSIQNFIQWINSQISQYNIHFTVTTDAILPYLANITLQDSNNNAVQWQMVGSGWDRLVGFDVSSDTLSTTKFGKSPYDLSQSCVVNIYLDGLQNCMSAAQGSIGFSINNDSTFGQILSWDNGYAGGSKKVYFQTPYTWSSQNHFILMNEENQPLTTVKGRQSSVDNCGLEVIMVFTLWIKTI